MVDFLRRHPWFHHHGRDVQDFSSQLEEKKKETSEKRRRVRTEWQQQNFKPAGDEAEEVDEVTLDTSLMASMSSGERILIWDVPFKNCSDSDIPVGKETRTSLTHRYEGRLLSKDLEKAAVC